MGYGLYVSTDVPPSLWGGYATHLYLHPDAEMEKAPANISSDVLTLFNPLTYAAEGLRHAMLPPIAGHPVETLPLGWVLLVLCGSLAVVLGAAIRLFRRRVVS